ncbi:MAG: hypothetical protein KTV68_03590 [Acidimicrobiia bacterium]|nr:hypothetical protein [Acidimicrobiia bacterium]MCY4435224.1 hypothetical protein [bacterium]
MPPGATKGLSDNRVDSSGGWRHPEHRLIGFGAPIAIIVGTIGIARRRGELGRPTIVAAIIATLILRPYNTPK